jgi:hypothetical protein
MERMLSQPAAVRRTVAVLLLVLTTLCASAAIYMGFVIASSQEEWRADTRQTLGRLRGLAAMTPSLANELAALPNAPVWPRFYPVGTGVDGSSLVLRDVVGLYAAAGATVLSATPVPSRHEEALDKFGVRVSASMTTSQIKTVIARLRGHGRYLRTELVSVYVPQVQSPEGDPPLTLTLEVFGYARKEVP